MSSMIAARNEVSRVALRSGISALQAALVGSGRAKPKATQLPSARESFSGDEVYAPAATPG